MPTKTNTPKLTGGKRGWSAALECAYYGDGQNLQMPCICYNPVDGFFVQSWLLRVERPFVWLEHVERSTCTGRPKHRHSDYGRVRREILGEQS